MFKMLLASTALTALVTTSAFAQSTTPTTDTGATTTTTDTGAAATTTDTGAAATTTDTGAATDTAVTAESKPVAPGPTLATDIIGSAVYESSAEDAASIGDINDIVVGPEGEVTSVVVGVGGFLGIGEKNVEVEYGALEWADRDGQRWLFANMTREQLEAAPDFDRSTIYTEAQSEPPAVNTTQNEPATGADPATGTDPNVTTGAVAPAEDATAERVQSGEGAVAPAEQQAQAIDRTTMTAVNAGEITADDLTGRTVYGANDENIGEVGEVLISADNQIEGFILDVGGFLGMGEKQVAISPENLEILANADGELTVFTPFTKEELEAQPEYTQEAWNSDRDSVILRAPSAG